MCSSFEGHSEEFSYGYRDENKLQRLRVSIPIPLKISAKEFACRLINAHSIPCYLEEGKQYSCFDRKRKTQTGRQTDKKQIKLENRCKYMDL